MIPKILRINYEREIEERERGREREEEGGRILYAK